MIKYYVREVTDEGRLIEVKDNDYGQIFSVFEEYYGYDTEEEALAAIEKWLGDNYVSGFYTVIPRITNDPVS